jgi:hypothetical protein
VSGPANVVHQKADKMDDDLVRQQSQQLLKFRVVSRWPKSPPILSTFSGLASDTDELVMERLYQHYRDMFKNSWLSTLLSFVLMRKLALGFTTYLVPVGWVFPIFG